MEETKFVVKRDGTKAEIRQERIKERLLGLCDGLNMEYINLDIITEKVFKGIYSGESIMFLSLNLQASKLLSWILFLQRHAPT